MLIQFGTYPQTATGTDKTPIQWRVLEEKDGELLFIADKILECVPYHTSYTIITWQECSLRKWLNKDFYTRAFSDVEKSKILTSSDNGNGIESANDLPATQDKVFLLNTAEVNQYFSSDYARQASGTVYAKWVDNRALHVDKGSSWWWLRNRGSGGSGHAAIINYNGCVSDYGGNVDRGNFGVRPAVRVRL